MTTLLDRSAMTSREAIRDLYDAYYEALDAVRLEEWPMFFAEECTYRIISRENHERGFRLAAVSAESRGMLIDRVTGIVRTQVFAPRYYRRFPGPLRILPEEAGAIPVEHNLLIVQTLIDQPSEIAICARCYDRVAVEDGRLLIKQRDVVYDSEMLPNSLIYPA